MSDALDPRLAKKSRPVHVYKVPMGVDPSIESVGLVEITSDEELMAEKLAHGDRGRIPIELAKSMISEIDGKRVSQADGSVDSAWERMTPKMRNLITSAYVRLHIPQKEETDSFFASLEVKVA